MLWKIVWMGWWEMGRILGRIILERSLIFLVILMKLLMLMFLLIIIMVIFIVLWFGIWVRFWMGMGWGWGSSLLWRRIVCWWMRCVRVIMLCWGWCFWCIMCWLILSFLLGVRWGILCLGGVVGFFFIIFCLCLYVDCNK